MAKLFSLEREEEETRAGTVPIDATRGPMSEGEEAIEASILDRPLEARQKAGWRRYALWGAVPVACVAGAAAGWFLLAEPMMEREQAALVVAQTPADRTPLSEVTLPTLDIAGGANASPDDLDMTAAWAVDSPALPRANERVITLSGETDAALVEASAYGPLPRIADDGRKPMAVYARPTVRASGDDSARIALVLTGLGLSAEGTRRSIEAMPGDVALAFVPYADQLSTWTSLARGEGHELLLQVPQEPYGYPDNDPGPKALLSRLPERENMERLRWSMGRMQAYVGVMPFMGERFAIDDGQMTPVLGEIAARGLFYLDRDPARASTVGETASRLGASFASAETVIEPGAAGDIDAQLAALEQSARRTGVAVAVAPAHPGVLERLSSWTRDMDARGVRLVPLSSVVRQTGL